MEPTRQPRNGTPWWRGRGLVIGIPYGWLLLFFLAPFLIVAKYSVSEMGDIRVEDLFTYVDGALKDGDGKSLEEQQWTATGTR